MVKNDNKNKKIDIISIYRYNVCAMVILQSLAIDLLSTFDN